jgi:predicted naringenin-chalcone synthase
VEIQLTKALRLPVSVLKTHVGFMGCHGALNGLRVAQAFCEADPTAQVLLCAVELCSLHYHYGWDGEKMVANALFADGAAAVVVLPKGSDSSGTLCLKATGSCLVPDSEDAMTWRIGDHGFEMTLSPRVPDLIAAYLRPWLAQWLTTQGLSLEDIRTWAVHPGGPRILGAVAESLELPEQALAASQEVLAHCGNMSSPTILFILKRLQQSNAPGPWVALGFGPGLVAEAALIE